MRYFIFIFPLLLLSVIGNAQSQHWSLYLNKAKQFSASVDTLQQFRLSKREKGSLKLSFPDRSKAFFRTVIIMMEPRNAVLEKEIKSKCQSASFGIDTLLAKTNGKPFAIYIRDIPADPQKAMLVRIAPVAICNVQWKE